MTIRRTVAVKQLPEIGNARQRQIFFREMQRFLDVDRPSVVLDCSNLRKLDRAIAYLLLCCLEEAMKRNGDVKLASLPSGAEVVLNATGMHRLFDIFNTTDGAVTSFHLPLAAVAQAPLTVSAPQEPNTSAA